MASSGIQSLLAKVPSADRDGIYGSEFSRATETLGIEEVLSTTRSPWLNPFCERVIGSIRRECLDRVIILNNEGHLRRILQSYFAYYHESRTHLSLDKDCPVLRAVDLPRMGNVVAFPQVGGHNHRCARRGLSAGYDRPRTFTLPPEAIRWTP